MRKSSMALPYLQASRRRCECGRHRGLNGLSRADRKAYAEYEGRVTPLRVKAEDQSSTVGGTADLSLVDSSPTEKLSGTFYFQIIQKE